MTDREQWTSRRGFILATIGAAVGIGNIWRFSYVAGENGGAVFLGLYLIFVLLVGLPLVIAELSLGRRGQGDAVAAFESAAHGGHWRLIGWVGIIGATLILGYYAVIAGWTLKYVADAAMGDLWRNGERLTKGYGGYFQAFIASPAEPVFYQAAMLGLAMLVVAGGVKRGIELINRWLMPVLALIVCGLAGYAVMLPGAGAGVRFLLAPDWGALARPEVYAAALGQAFFSLGVGMSIFITYGSYLPKNISIPSSASVIVVGDSFFAVVAGLAIFPAVFAFGADPAAGPELAFVILPRIFLQMPGGAIAGTIFFFLLSAAALTSMVSLLEVSVAMATHRLGMGRRMATAMLGAVVFLLGLPSALSFSVLDGVRINGSGVFDTVDAAVSNILLPLGGILIALFVGWRVERRAALIAADMPENWFGGLWIWLLRTVAPATILVVFLRWAVG